VGTARPLATVPVGMRAARLAVLAVFYLNGFALAGWFVQIPAVQERPGIGEGPLGVALLGAAVGANLSVPVARALVSRLDSRRVVGVTTLLLITGCKRRSRCAKGRRFFSVATNIPLLRYAPPPLPRLYPPLGPQ
jgi:hypothetical protein